MLTPEGEEIIKLQRKAQHSFLLISTNQGTFINVNNIMLGEDADSIKEYVLAVDDLVNEGLAKQVGDHAFDLTTAGRKIAEALIEEDEITVKVPDSCKIFVQGKPCNVTFFGADLNDPKEGERDVLKHIVQIGGKPYPGHAGIFHVELGDMKRTFYVILNGIAIPKVGCMKDKNTISRTTLELLLKRPGCRIVRECLLSNVAANKHDALEYPRFPDDKNINLLESIEEYVDILDDQRPQILADCERDILETLIKDRENRKPIRTTAAQIASSSTKRRFYSIRGHIRETLGDLTDKGLIRTEDNVHYQIEVLRMADIRRVIAGLPSDDLYDVPPPASQAAYVPVSTNEFDAFLCHASEDKEAIVMPFAKVMEQNELKPWIDDKELIWGDNLVRRIQDGLVRSRFVVVFLSESFLAKKWPDTELNTALSMEIGGKTLVLPLLLGLTHETLQARYPIVSAKVYREIPTYDPETGVTPEKLQELVDELKTLIRRD